MGPLLVESTLLSCLGGSAGLVLAYSLNSLLISFLPPASTPLRLSSTPDWRVLAFTFGIAFVTGILFGLFPSLSEGNTDAHERLLSFLASIFGVVATLAAAMRLREIGIRIALGAKTNSVILLVMKEILLLIAGGIAIGIPAAILLSKYVQRQLYGRQATDPLTLTLLWR